MVYHDGKLLRSRVGLSRLPKKKKKIKEKEKKLPGLLFNKSSASCFFRDLEWSLKLKATDSKTHTTQTQVDLFLYANFFSLKTVGN